MAKDAKGHGSEKRGAGGGMPLEGHPYHQKTDAELRYIAKDAGQAAQASRGLSAFNPTNGQREDTEGKYLDQMNDASTVLGFRQRGGADLSQDKQAAAKLAEGSAPGKGAVPVHPGASGRAQMTPGLATGVGMDAGNKSMRSGGRTAWNQDDADAATKALTNARGYVSDKESKQINNQKPILGVAEGYGRKGGGLDPYDAGVFDGLKRNRGR